jgi:hypothetical protein
LKTKSLRKIRHHYAAKNAALGTNMPGLTLGMGRR